MTDQIRSNLVWHSGTVKRTDRERLNCHRGLTLWFTGLSAAGKSTLAVATENALFDTMSAQAAITTGLCATARKLY